jgi:hypothetical protein
VLQVLRDILVALVLNHIIMVVKAAVEKVVLTNLIRIGQVVQVMFPQLLGAAMDLLHLGFLRYLHNHFYKIIVVHII